MSFIWNGVSSDTMKFNVTSRQVYNAPAYDLNAIEVPGRSGDLLNPQNRFKNKQISYTGFLKASDFEGSTWREKLSTGLIQLKGWLCSDAGAYHELTDDYDPGFTRYGYISGEMAISDIEDRPFGVTLTVTFNCKPFMYKAGEPMELPETKSASGSIITITDGAENTPLKSAVVNIEPVQDLHGYDYPWPAGGGKNLISPILSPAYESILNGVTESEASEKSIKLTSASYTYACKRMFYELPAGTYTFKYLATSSDSYTPTVSIYNKATGSLIMNGNSIAPSTPRTFTLAETTTLDIRLFVTTNTAAVRTVTFSDIQLESGSSVAAWTPYSNICPISGWTQVNGWHTGKNIISNSMAEIGTAWNGGSNSARGRLVVQCKPSTKYTLSMNGTSSMSGIYRQDSAVVPASSAGYDITNRMPYTFTTGASSKYIIIAFSKTGITQGDVDALKLQLEEGSAATAYESTAVPINFSLGQTVYGGTLDAVSGKLVIDRVCKTLTTARNLSGAYLGSIIYNASSPETTDADFTKPFICNRFKYVGNQTASAEWKYGSCINANGTSFSLWIQNGAFADLAAATSWLGSNATQICYYLATPIEVDLTPQTIKTLLGVNNIWADAGSMEIEYPVPTENPYPFGSRPLYEITMDGTGTLVVNGKEWTITDYTGTLYCDSETMDWYDASQLRNNIVSGDGWPVFEAGENSVSYTGDITKVMVTPRWRTL